MGAWIATHWFDLLQSISIVASLVFTGSALRQQTKASRISTLITLTQNHRDIWREFLTRTDLARVRDKEVDLQAKPVTNAEETFVKFVITHLVSAYQARRLKEVAGFGDSAADASLFFCLPIPQAVWEKVKRVHDKEFVDFVEGERKDRLD